MKALVGAFNQEKALVGAFSVIVQLHRLIDLRHYSVRTKWRFVHVYQSRYLDSHHGPLLVLIPWELHYGRANDFPNQVRFTKPRVMPAPQHFFNGSFNKICKNHFCLQQQGNKAEVNYVLTNWGASNPPRTIQLKSEVYFIECIYHEMFDVRLQLNLCQTQSIKLLLLWYILDCTIDNAYTLQVSCSSFKL